jgi:hypothetical protein
MLDRNCFQGDFENVNETVSYRTVVTGHENQAACDISDPVLKAIGCQKLAHIKITINGYTDQSTRLLETQLPPRQVAEPKSEETRNRRI